MKKFLAALSALFLFSCVTTPEEPPEEDDMGEARGGGERVGDP